jgi:hypothetical protein
LFRFVVSIFREPVRPFHALQRSNQSDGSKLATLCGAAYSHYSYPRAVEKPS